MAASSGFSPLALIDADVLLRMHNPGFAQTDVPILLTARKFHPDMILSYNTKHWLQQDEFPAMTPEQFFGKT